MDAGKRSVNIEHFDVKTLYRYGTDFAIGQPEVLALFRAIPFLNGGLFECLDRGRDYFDGFSRNTKKQARIPNRLFFDEKTGLIPLLAQYHFTVEENSPGDEEVALDPELLGKVFENLLGAYNPETKVAARNATGSFYTPREIVNYMVDESLIAHVLTKIGPRMDANEREEKIDSCKGAEAQREALDITVRSLFTDGERPADEALCKRIDAALVTAKILDPACGSGAFPMGMLLRMVELLRVLRRIPPDESVYDLKLELIENCIYGADIQCIAVQISKLRFFISLVVEQRPTSNTAANYGIHTLPNLETKFVAADSLIGLEWMFNVKDGFDVVIGNPPYVQIQKLPDNTKTRLSEQSYCTFSKTADLLKPWLRGKDIRRWYADYQDLYVIFTRQGTDIDSYPSIRNYLQAFRNQLEPKPNNHPAGKSWQGRKSGTYKWFEIQDNIAYHAEFEQPKIVYADIAKLMRASFDTDGAFCANTMYIIPSRDFLLLGLLNSRVFNCYF